MIDTASLLTDVPTEVPRILGRIHGAAPGPTLLVVAGIHGNEPTGVVAARAVLSMLERDSGPLRGEFVALAGNRAALARRQRFVDRDLNRQWIPGRVEALRRAPRGSLVDAEDLEQREMLEAIHGVLSDARGPVYVVDLHTTSAAGAPFCLPGPGRAALDFTRVFPPTLILGFQHMVPGLLQEYLASLGCICAAIEGGQHMEAVSAERHQAVLWLALAAAGLVEAADLPGLKGYREVLEKARGDLPPVVEVYHRQSVRPEDGFEMQPGFANLQRVRSGELLARDRRGEIRAKRDEMLLMPLYQKLGDDGFFLCREVGPLELRLRSTLMRFHPQGP